MALSTDLQRSPLPVGEEKRWFIQRLFTRIAPRYDWFNRLASCGLDQRWRRHTVQRAALTPGMSVLDVCTGTGDLALLAAHQLRPLPGTTGSLVVGVDMNREMLAEAQRKQQREELAMSWLAGDGLTLPFGEAFDRVFIGFSTRNLSDLRAGLDEMIRVLRPNGQLLILETGRPANPVLRVGYELFLFTIARAIGFVLTGNCWPFTYLARSVKRFISPEQFTDLLQAAGTTVEYVPLSGGLASLFVATKQVTRT